MPFSKKFKKIMGFPKEGDNVCQFTVESLSVGHIYVKRSKPRRYEYPVKILVRGEGSKEDAKTALTRLLNQKNVCTTSGYGNPYSCSIGQMEVSQLDEETYSIEAQGVCTRVSEEVYREYEAAKLKRIEEMALKVYEALFQDKGAVETNGVTYQFSRTSASKIRFVKIEGYTFIKQNPRKESHWGKMAQEGHRIMWVCRGPAYLYHVIDGQFSKLKRAKKSKRK